MICHFCTKPISDAARRVEVHVQLNPSRGSEYKVYGNVPLADGRLADAWGPLAMVFHNKCWLAFDRRRKLREAKDADPSAQQGDGADWREPVTAEVEDFRPRESDRDH
jgi:hypothetical protein